MSREVIVSEDLKDLVEEYLQDMLQEIALFNNAYKVKDFDTIAKMAHKVKGNAGSYGFDELGGVGAMLEDFALKREDAMVKENIEMFSNYIQEVKVKYE